MRRVLALSLLLLAPAAPAALAAPARRLTVDEAIELALRQNPTLRAARAEVRAAEDSARSARGRLLPSVHLGDEYQHWNSAFEVPFDVPGPLPAGGMKPVLRARDQDTNTFTVVGGQPLVGSSRLSQDHAALADTAEARRAQARAGEATLREAIRTEYLRLFEARATADIARASERQLAEQVAVAESKLKAGVLTRADVLRIQVAVANARQQEIQAQAQAEVSRADLLAAVGLEEEELDFAEPAGLLQAAAFPAPASAGAAYREALGRRPEVAAAARRSSAARHQERSRFLSLLPDLDLEGGYVRIDGQVFAPKNAEFIGLKAQWAVWEWGVSFYAQRAAAEQAEAAALAAEDQRRQIGREVTTRLSQVTATDNAVKVAETAIVSAEEAYRVTDALVRAGSATTTDLLDAQAALTQTRLNLTRARYEQAIARVSLGRVLGE